MNHYCVSVDSVVYNATKICGDESISFVECMEHQLCFLSKYHDMNMLVNKVKISFLSYR